MRYVDLGVLPSISLEKKKKKSRRTILLVSGLLAAVIIGVAGYAFYWPLSALIGQLIKNPGISSAMPNPDIKNGNCFINSILLLI